MHTRLRTYVNGAHIILSHTCVQFWLVSCRDKHQTIRPNEKIDCLVARKQRQNAKSSETKPAAVWQKLQQMIRRTVGKSFFKKTNKHTNKTVALLQKHFF
jgi:mRNA degradation ribonuclease J1/J2